MGRFRGVRAALLVGLVAAVLGLTGASPAGAESLTFDDPMGAARLVVLANEDRSAAGLAPLELRYDVFEIADAHSRRMAVAGDLFHNDGYFTAEVRQRLSARSLGENVALNRSVDDAHARLMQSPGHRANLLSPKFAVVGMAVVRTADGMAYITQNFVEPLAAPAASPTPASEDSTGPDSPDSDSPPSADGAGATATGTEAGGTAAPAGASSSSDGTPTGSAATASTTAVSAGGTAAGRRPGPGTGSAVRPTPASGTAATTADVGPSDGAPVAVAADAGGTPPADAPPTTDRASVSVVTEPISNATPDGSARSSDDDALLLGAALATLAVLATSGSVFRVLRRPTDSGV